MSVEAEDEPASLNIIFRGNAIISIHLGSQLPDATIRNCKLWFIFQSIILHLMVGALDMVMIIRGESAH